MLGLLFYVLYLVISVTPFRLVLSAARRFGAQESLTEWVPCFTVLFIIYYTLIYKQADDDSVKVQPFWEQQNAKHGLRLTAAGKSGFDFLAPVWQALCKQVITANAANDLDTWETTPAKRFYLDLQELFFFLLLAARPGEVVHRTM